MGSDNVSSLRPEVNETVFEKSPQLPSKFLTLSSYSTLAKTILVPHQQQQEQQISSSLHNVALYPSSSYESMGGGIPSLSLKSPSPSERNIIKESFSDCQTRKKNCTKFSSTNDDGDGNNDNRDNQNTN